MSRSIHRTLKGVFGGKPASEIDDMIKGEDEDVLELIKKRQYKRHENEKRAEQFSVDAHETNMPHCRTYLFCFMAQPTEKAPEFATNGQAWVNAWILRPTLKEAKQFAIDDIESQGWQVLCCESEEETTLRDYENDDQDLQYFEQVQLDREVFVYNYSPRHTVFRIVAEAKLATREIPTRVHIFILNESVGQADENFYAHDFWSKTKQEGALSLAKALLAGDGLSIVSVLEQAPLDWLTIDKETSQLCDIAEDEGDCYFFVEDV